MKTTPLHPDFAVEVHGVDLRDVTEAALYPDLRALFERHSLLFFRGQHLDDDAHLAFARLFGPIEDRSNVSMDGPVAISCGVSNVAGGGGLYDEDDWRLKDLQGNMFWHTDSTFLPVPALANVLQARVVPSTGGATEFASTRAGFRALPSEIRDRLRQMVFRHRCAHSRTRIDPALGKRDKFTMWPDQRWRAVWTNPETGEEALYVASHVFAVDGMDNEEGAAFAESLVEAMTPADAIYTHAWAPGDVLIWDERATLHRGTPWPYDQQRTLVSVCVSVRDADGLA